MGDWCTKLATGNSRRRPKETFQDGKQQKAAYDHIPIVKEEGALTFNAISVCAMNVELYSCGNKLYYWEEKVY